jgi:hypothetical protein
MVSVEIKVYSRENMGISMMLHQLLKCSTLKRLYCWHKRIYQNSKFITPYSTDDLLIINAIIKIGRIPLEEHIHFCSEDFSSISELCKNTGLHNFPTDVNGDFTKLFTSLIGDDTKFGAMEAESIDDIVFPLKLIHRH